MTTSPTARGALAVLLHADVADSTVLVRADERLAHDRIRAAFQRLGRVVADYHGEVVEIRGDAMLARFDRASNAAIAALAFQQGEAPGENATTDVIQPSVRVGIAIGEMIFEDDTVTGAGVVLAQRVEQLAEPGGICITPAVREALPSRLPLSIDNLGLHPVKGFDEAINVYRVRLAEDAELPAPESPGAPERQGGWRTGGRKTVLLAAGLCLAVAVSVLAYRAWRDVAAGPSPAGGISTATTNEVESAVGNRPAIAVLPFDNMSGDPDQEYFADGITEDLTTDLSKISGLFVVARNSAFAYKGQSTDLRQVARELGVRYILEGSIRRVADQIRINAQLIDGESGGHLWADRFDGGMADIFALQDDVNRRIVDALKVELTDADLAHFDVVETSVPEAYDLVLRGVEKYNQFSHAAIVEARALFLDAIALDPGYARAFANVALTYSAEINFYWSDDQESAITEGLLYAEKASSLDPDIPQIYFTRSMLLLSQRQHQAAMEAALRTIDVHPDYADGYAALAFISSYMGEFDRALEALKRAQRINPQGTGIYLGVEGRVYFQQHRYEEALAVLDESLERNPAVDVIHLFKAASLAELGRLEDAEWSVEEALAINPGLTLSQIRERNLYLRETDIAGYLAALEKAGLPE